MNELDEMTISLKDLLYRILLRWRLILVYLVLGALIFGGVGYMKNLGAAKKATQGKPLTAKEQVEKYEAVLTENEIAVVQAAVNTYFDYQKNMELIKEYYTNSIRMQLNPNEVPNLRLQYLIDNHYEAVYPVVEAKDYTGDIINSYTMMLSDGDVYKKVAAVLGDDMNVAYVGELIGTGSSADILTVYVTGRDEEECKAISRVLQEIIQDGTSDLKKLYGEFDITLIQESYYERANTDLLAEQRKQENDYNSLLNNMNGLANNMTDNQKNYYYALLEVEEGEAVVGEEDAEHAPEVGEDVQVELFHKKYILLGAVLGVFLVCCYLACRYLLSARLRVKEDLEGPFGIVNLGVLPLGRPKRKFLDCVDRWISSAFGEKNGRFSEEERIRMICAGIRIGAKKSDMKSVYLTGVCSDEACEQVKAMLCEQIKKDIEIVRFGKSVVYDPEALEAMVSSDGVVFVEQIDGSRYDELKKEIEICRQNQVPVIGSVILS